MRNTLLSRVRLTATCVVSFAFLADLPARTQAEGFQFTKAKVDEELGPTAIAAEQRVADPKAPPKFPPVAARDALKTFQLKKGFASISSPPSRWSLSRSRWRSTRMGGFLFSRYGRFGSYFEYTIEKDEPLTVNYRLWLQEGLMQPKEVAGPSNNFVEPVEVTVHK